MRIKLLLGVLILGLLGYGVFYFYRPSRPHIIFVLVDTLRADHLSMNGYERDTSPNIDAFARENLNFSFAVAAAPWTPASMSSIFTGLYSSVHRMSPPNDRELARRTSSKLSDRFETFPETLRENGYKTAAIITNPWMKPEFGVVRGFDSYTYFDRAPAEKVNAAAFKLIRSLKQGAQPFFLYLHYMDPHNPYKPPKEYAARYEGPLKTVEYPPRQVKFMSLYDGEIRYFDDHFGNLLSFLKQEGIYQDARIILASDHGEQFMEHGNQGHGYRLFNEELRVPLVIKGPGLKGHIDLPVSLLDLYPTVFDLVGFDPPRPHQGYSLVSELEQRAEHGLLSEVHRNFSSKAYLSPQGHKLILDYNLNLGLIPAANHPAELETVTEPGAKYGEELTSSNVSLKKELLSNFKDLYKETLNLSLSLAGGSKDAEVSVSKETLNELKSLGYVN